MEPVQNAQPMPENQPTSSVQNNYKRNIIFLLVFLVVVIAGGILIVFASTNKKTENSTTQPYMAPQDSLAPSESVSSGTEEQQVESVTIDDPESDVRDIEKDVSSL